LALQEAFKNIFELWQTYDQQYDSYICSMQEIVFTKSTRI